MTTKKWNDDPFHPVKPEFKNSLPVFEKLLEQANQRAIPDPGCGICHNAGQLGLFLGYGYFFYYNVVARCGASWPNSVNPGIMEVYPVPHKPKEPLWEGDQLKLRIDLIQHIIARLKDL